MRCVREIDERGRGLFTLTDIPEGAEVIRGYVSLLPRECFDLHPTGVFPLAWDETHHALVWSALTFANHSETPNTTVETFKEAKLIRLVAIRDIKAGEEITYHYKCPLWFEPKPPARLVQGKQNGTT